MKKTITATLTEGVFGINWPDHMTEADAIHLLRHSLEYLEKKTGVRASKVQYKNTIGVKQSAAYYDLMKDGYIPSEFHKPLLEWMEYKHEKRAGYSKKGLQVLIDKWKRIGLATVEATILHSMENNWQGLFYDKIGTNGKSSIGPGANTLTALRDMANS